MSAPDHRAYLVEGDLRTPEDVLAWLAEQAEAEPASITMRMYERLYDRIDRERRQACRRAAHEAWVNAVDAREGERVWKDNAKKTHGCTYSPKECLRFAAEYRAERPGHLQRALAFRAAARQP